MEPLGVSGGQLGGYLPQDVPQGQGVGLVGVSAIGDVIYLTKEVVGFLGGGDDQDCFGAVDYGSHEGADGGQEAVVVRPGVMEILWSVRLITGPTRRL